MSRQLPLRTAATALVGPTIWATHFLSVYASESLLCRAGSPSAHDALVAGATIAALLVQGGHGVSLWRPRRMAGTRRELAGIAAALDALSALAVCLTALAAIALPACT